MRYLLLILVCTACHFHPTGEASPDAAPMPDAPAAPADAGSCAAGLAGAPCVLALYDQAAAACDPAAVAALHHELDARAGLGPLWAGGRALFRSAAPTAVAGSWNGWSTTAVMTAPFCGGDLVLAVTPVASGFWTYKLFDGTTWSLDPNNPEFAYDDFAGNPDHRNSVLDTPDSGRGHLVELDDACSQALGNCRAVTAYLPPGYDDPAAASTRYPVLFMHDGQNIWDDHPCCFGHTGWEINVTLDAEIAAHTVAPIIVIGAASTTNRNNEYGLDPATTAAFLAFQIGELQPHALTEVRGDGGRVYIAGSSLGGLMAMELGLGHPDVYAGAASLSGSFWVGQDTNTALRDQIPTFGKQPVAIYVDSGGDPSDDSDSAADTIEVRDLLGQQGWTISTSPACDVGPDALCYYWEQGATHDELAWKARSWRFLRYLFPG